MLRGRIDKDSRRVIGQVKEKSDTLHTAVLLEIASEESAGFQVHTHGAEDNGEVVRVTVVHALCRLDETCLSANLRSNFVVRETSSREDRDLLSTGNRVHGVNGRDTSRDHFFGVDLANQSLSHVFPAVVLTLE